MRLVMACLLVACSKGPQVQFVGSSCADPVACTAECETGIVVACDRGGLASRDPTERLALFRKGYEFWARICDFGAPESCMNGAIDSLRSRGSDNPTISEMAHDKEACELLEIWARGNGHPLTEPCP